MQLSFRPSWFSAQLVSSPSIPNVSSQTYTLPDEVLGKTQLCTCQQMHRISGAHCDSLCVYDIYLSLPDSPSTQAAFCINSVATALYRAQNSAQGTSKRQQRHIFIVQRLLSCTLLQKTHTLYFFLLRFLSGSSRLHSPPPLLVLPALFFL